MNLKKGYSLIEIVIGIAIITIFLVCTGSMINASYDNYRMVVQRNNAMELAIDEMEEILKSSDVKVGSYDKLNENMNMKAKIDVENVKSDTREYEDIYVVTINVEYTKTEKSTEKFYLELKSLKIVD